MKIKTFRKIKDLNEIVSLAKNRGFVFQSSEIYGGLSSCWDYGPLGSVLKQNVKKVWFKAMTKNPEIYPLDAAILMHPLVWKASGHVDGFSDPLVDCKDCKQRFRSDNTESYLNDKSCPHCGSKNLSEPRQFNLMFKTQMGAIEDSSSTIYLRPETAQGHFVNFLNYKNTTRSKIPFGIAAVGKSFRNEITPGNFIFRTREFEQMEMQYFVKPGNDEEQFDLWKQKRMDFFLKYGLAKENLRFHPHPKNELAHYAKAAEDIQYNFPMGFSELEGIHNRTNFDLSAHSKMSGKNLEYVSDTGERYIPYVIETAVGCDRLILAFLCEAFRVETLEDDKGNTEERVVLGLHPAIAPIKAAVFPLMKKPELIKVAKEIYDTLVEDYEINYDESSTSIGKKYRRQDEVGTPYCITVDYESLNDKKVTVRDRDSMEQDRVNIQDLETYLRNKIRG